MDIVLIQCPVWTIRTPPYNLALLKAVLKKKGHQAICYDLNIELYHYAKENFEKDSWSDGEKGSCWYDKDFVLSIIKKHKDYIDDFVSKTLGINSTVIGFSVSDQSRFFSIELAKEIKRREPKKIIIFGGPECFRDSRGFNLAEETFIDAVCLGEGEICLGDLLDIIEKKSKIDFCQGFAYRNERGEIIDCGDPEIVEDLDSLPFADFSDFDPRKYGRYDKKALSLLTSKGCVNRCAFCSESVRMKKFRSRTGKSVFSEIICQLEKYPYIEEYFFNDSLINGNIKMLDDLCDLLIENNIHIIWGGQATIRKEMTKEFLMKLKRAGCTHFSYGVESGSDNILKLMRKGYTANLAERVIHDTYEAGIISNFNIIVGFPGETEVEFQETVNFLKRNSGFADHIWLNTLQVTENTELNENRDKWGIQFFTDASDWQSIDGKNNYEERLERVEVCRDLIKEKACADEYKRVKLNIKLGDKFREEGKFDLALNSYLKAKGIGNGDQNTIDIINDRIRDLENEASKFKSENEKLNQSELEQRKIILKSKPLRLGIVLTNLCNLKCIMCHEDRYRGTDTLPKSSLKKINEVLPYIELINWQGGEIFCVGYMKEIFREFLNYPYIQHNITTNGLLIDKEWAEILVNLKVSLSFSIDSVVKDTYEYIRKGSKFEKLIENINLLNNIEQKFQRSIHKTIIVVVMESNYKQLDLFIDFAKKYSFKELWFYPVIPKPEYRESIFIDMNPEVRQELMKSMKTIKHLGPTLGLDIQCRLPEIEGDLKTTSSEPSSYDNNQLFCIFPWKTMWIDATRGGRITPGCACSEEIGNIYTDSLLEVWNGIKMQEYRRRIANNDLSLCSHECLSELVVKKRLIQDY